MFAEELEHLHVLNWKATHKAVSGDVDHDEEDKGLAKHRETWREFREVFNGWLIHADSAELGLCDIYRGDGPAVSADDLDKRCVKVLDSLMFRGLPRKLILKNGRKLFESYSGTTCL